LSANAPGGYEAQVSASDNLMTVMTDRWMAAIIDHNLLRGLN
jgi:hypothetical protein